MRYANIFNKKIIKSGLKKNYKKKLKKKYQI